MNAFTKLCGGKGGGCCGTQVEARKADGPPLQIKELRRGSCDPIIGKDGKAVRSGGLVVDTRCAYITLATNDTYALGCLVLGQSLRRVSARKELVVMVTPTVSDTMRKCLLKTFDKVKVVDLLDSADVANLQLLRRPELGVTLTKLHCWAMTEYKKAVFLDADTLVLQNCDELFEEFEEFSAAPDVGWPDCFNSGVFVFKPSTETFKSLLKFASVNGSFDGGDQGLLNMYFSDWPTKTIKKHLPFIYNMVASIVYTYRPAYKIFGSKVKIVHFLGATKPWHMEYDLGGNRVRSGGLHPDLVDLVDLWWSICIAKVFPQLEDGIAGHAAVVFNKYRHATGNNENLYYVDYRGLDAYSVIQDYVLARVPDNGKKPGK